MHRSYQVKPGKVGLYRYQYRMIADSDEAGPWHYLTAAQNTAKGARRLVAGWNRRDRGRVAWKYEPVLPSDIEAVRGVGSVVGF